MGPFPKLAPRRIWRLIVVFVCGFASAAPLGCTGTAPLPPKAVDLNRTGADALATGNLDLAEARFSLALEYHPSFVEALTNLGLVEMQRGNFDRARQLFERALRVNSDIAQPHHALGVLAEREHRPDLAAEHYRDALKVNPGFAPARANLGRLLFDAQQYDDAREQFVRLLEIEPRSLEGHLGLAETLLRLGRPSESDGAVERARTALGDCPELAVLAARAQLRRGNVASAESALIDLARDHGNAVPSAWVWLAVAHLASGHLEQAIDAAKSALAADRNDSVATYVVAMALRRKGDSRATAWLERARVLSPGNSVLAVEVAAARGPSAVP